MNRTATNWLVLLLWWFLVYEDGLTFRWGAFNSKLECQAMLEKVAGFRQTSGCLSDRALSQEYQGPIAGPKA